jgi:hypothetical protein
MGLQKHFQRQQQPSPHLPFQLMGGGMVLEGGPHYFIEKKKLTSLNRGDELSIRWVNGIQCATTLYKLIIDKETSLNYGNVRSNSQTSLPLYLRLRS